MENLYGNFAWFQGVVEDRNDPLRLGRVRVRIIGYHTDDLELIKTGDLPWAVPIMPVTSAGTSDIGLSPTGMVEGSHVVGFFADGINAQQPMIMGTILGIPETAANKAMGFNDPNGKYPTRTDEQDTNRLARNEPGSDGKPDPEFAHPILKTKVDGLEKDVKVGSQEDPIKWSEPITPYATIYPANHVQETEGGHIEERDDTENSERYHRYHPVGNFIEEGPDGTTVRKIKGSKYEIIEKGDNVLIKGVKNLRVEGSENVTVGGSKDVLVEGNDTLVVKGNETVTITGNQTITVDGNTILTVKGNIAMNADGSISIVAAGVLTLSGKTIQM